MPPKNPESSKQESDRQAPGADRPWRMEGLPPPKGGKPPQKPWWKYLVQGALVYAAVFAFLTIQDRAPDAHTIPYTEFDRQVEANNVAEVFARGYTIQGELRAPKTIPAEKAARKIVIPPAERRRTAYHEAGHALLGMLQPGADPVRKVSIIPRGRALGMTLSTPEQDRYGYDAAYLKGRMVGSLGGMAAERVVFGVVTTGAESDLQTCTGIARSMVGRWGMSEKVGPMSIFQPDMDPRMNGVAEATLTDVDGEVKRLIDDAYGRAIQLLTEHRARLDAIVARLLERETLDEAEVHAAAGLAIPSSSTLPAPSSATAEAVGAES